MSLNLSLSLSYFSLSCQVSLSVGPAMSLAVRYSKLLFTDERSHPNILASHSLCWFDHSSAQTTLLTPFLHMFWLFSTYWKSHFPKISEHFAECSTLWVLGPYVLCITLSMMSRPHPRCTRCKSRGSRVELNWSKCMYLHIETQLNLFPENDKRLSLIWKYWLVTMQVAKVKLVGGLQEENFFEAHWSRAASALDCAPEDLVQLPSISGEPEDPDTDQNDFKHHDTPGVNLHAVGSGRKKSVPRWS